MGSAEKRNYVEIEGLAVAPELVEFLAKEAAPGTGVEPEKFWKGFAAIIRDLTPRTAPCSPSVTSFRPGSTPGTRKTATRATARPITSSF